MTKTSKSIKLSDMEKQEIDYDAKTLGIKHFSDYIRFLHREFGHRMAEKFRYLKQNENKFTVWDLNSVRHWVKKGWFDKEFLKKLEKEQGL